MSASQQSAPALVFGTGNQKKALELADLLSPLGLDVRTLADFPHAVAIEEVGSSFAENATLKATRQAAHLSQWVLGDDSGLVVDALDAAPGIYSARYAGAGATDAENRRKLLAALDGIEPARRMAHFACSLALADPTGKLRASTSGRCHGRIRTCEAGSGGFGYDPLFEILEYHRTFGELAGTVKAVLSHRARAMHEMVPRIRELIESGAW